VLFSRIDYRRPHVRTWLFHGRVLSYLPKIYPSANETWDLADLGLNFPAPTKTVLRKPLTFTGVRGNIDAVDNIHFMRTDIAMRDMWL
jgi:hypothetical protein